MRRAANSGFVRLPAYGAGEAIGLLGGSFNPPHEGHLLASRLALTRLGLSQVWWLATPGNPLKSSADLLALHARLDAARALVHDPRIAVTGIESEIGARYTADTLAYLQRRAPGARFVWIMGADNLAQFHRWRRWREIAALAPMLVIDPHARSLAYLEPPAWMFLHARRSEASSTALRARRSAALS